MNAKVLIKKPVGSRLHVLITAICALSLACASPSTTPSTSSAGLLNQPGSYMHPLDDEHDQKTIKWLTYENLKQAYPAAYSKALNYVMASGRDGSELPRAKIALTNNFGGALVTSIILEGAKIFYSFAVDKLKAELELHKSKFIAENLKSVQFYVHKNDYAVQEIAGFVVTRRENGETDDAFTMVCALIPPPKKAEQRSDKSLDVIVLEVVVNRTRNKVFKPGRVISSIVGEFGYKIEPGTVPSMQDISDPSKGYFGKFKMDVNTTLGKQTEQDSLKASKIGELKAIPVVDADFGGVPTPAFPLYARTWVKQQDLSFIIAAGDKLAANLEANEEKNIGKAVEWAEKTFLKAEDSDSK